MAYLKLTANYPPPAPTGYFIYLNTDQIIGWGPDPASPGNGKVYMMHGPYWSLGDGSFPVTQSPAAIAALWPVDASSLTPGSVPLSALATTGTANATTVLHGNGAWS